MADRPILFSAPMVRALLAGTKSQTRRAMKPQPAPEFIEATIGRDELTFRPAFLFGDPTHKTLRRLARPGDVLWVREAIRAEDHDDTWNHGVRYLADEAWAQFADHGDVSSDAYGQWWTVKAYRSDDPDLTGGKTVPPIHMPRWASRLTLTVTDVRVQRLDEISHDDAAAEGIIRHTIPHGATLTNVGTGEQRDLTVLRWSGAPDLPVRGMERRAYRDLWEQINGAGSWAANPWVVAYSFTVERRNIDEAPHV